MTPRTLFLALALAAPAPAAAQSAAGQPSSQFQDLWTSWRGANRQSLQAEGQAMQQVRQEIATTDPVHQAMMRDRGRALGERVGEIVRGGDCDEGERVARRAGDFALVEAVRAHCRQLRTDAQRR